MTKVTGEKKGLKVNSVLFSVHSKHCVLPKSYLRFISQPKKPLETRMNAGVPKGIRPCRARARRQASTFESPCPRSMLRSVCQKKTVMHIHNGFCLLLGVPKGIRTPVLTVKG